MQAVLGDLLGAALNLKAREVLVMYPHKIKYSLKKSCLGLIILFLTCSFSFHRVSAQETVVSDLPATLMVSGSPVGIRLEGDGVTVLGFVGFMSEGEFVNPGVHGGLLAGDCILKVDGQNVHTSEELRQVVSASPNGRLTVLIRRDGTEITLPIQVYRDDENSEYRIGVWVRDGVTGIGTMTFYDPEYGCFAALGHGISGENGLVPIASGRISKVTVLDAIPGRPGTPGELKGYFSEPQQIAGIVRCNCDCGIMGTCEDCFCTVFSLCEYPVMPGEKVHTGPAYILSTVCGDTPELYTVEITATLKDRIYDTKGLTLKITDPSLLEKTGGIVQGMSGSPIIQDGCIVGAVTHVTMKDPRVGYGIYIENMITHARQVSDRSQKAA